MLRQWTRPRATLWAPACRHGRNARHPASGEQALAECRFASGSAAAVLSCTLPMLSSFISLSYVSAFLIIPLSLATHMLLYLSLHIKPAPQVNPIHRSSLDVLIWDSHCIRHMQPSPGQRATKQPGMCTQI